METPAPSFLLQIRAARVLLLGTAALCCHTKHRRNSHLTKPDFKGPHGFGLEPLHLSCLPLFVAHPMQPPASQR